MTPAHLIMSYAQESGAVGKEKVNFTEREGSFFLSESLAHVFGWLPFFFCGIVHLPVNHGTQDRWWTGQKKKTARGDWYLRKVGYIRPCLHLQTAGDS